MAKRVGLGSEGSNSNKLSLGFDNVLFKLIFRFVFTEDCAAFTLFGEVN